MSKDDVQTVARSLQRELGVVELPPPTLDCAANGSVIAVGLQGNGGKWSLPRALVAWFDETGDLLWLDVAPETPSSSRSGVWVDDMGFFAVGRDHLDGCTVDGSGT